MHEALFDKILLVDDDADLTGMLREYLLVEGFHVDICHRGEPAIAAILNGQYDAMILDVMLPDLSGMEILRLVRQTSDVSVIMLTAKGDELDRVIGLELGADDYVSKPFSPRELVARLRAVLRRRSTATGTGMIERYELGNILLDIPHRRASCGEQLLELTQSEFSILHALMKARETVVTKDELSVLILGRIRQAYDRSVDVHVSNLRHKLSANGANISIRTVRGVGYQMAAGI